MNVDSIYIMVTKQRIVGSTHSIGTRKKDPGEYNRLLIHLQVTDYTVERQKKLEIARYLQDNSLEVSSHLGSPLSTLRPDNECG